jgi:hypothetical protein
LCELPAGHCVKGQYAALSYCWGGENPASLQKKTFDDFKRGIDEANLPQTLQDAFYVARSLQIGYIWIDALCIMQDDREDWER